MTQDIASNTLIPLMGKYTPEHVVSSENKTIRVVLEGESYHSTITKMGD